MPGFFSWPLPLCYPWPYVIPLDGPSPHTGPLLHVILLPAWSLSPTRSLSPTSSFSPCSSSPHAHPPQLRRAFPPQPDPRRVPTPSPCPRPWGRRASYASRPPRGRPAAARVLPHVTPVSPQTPRSRLLYQSSPHLPRLSPH